MVVAGGVEGELAEDLAGGGVDDGDVEVLDDEPDVGSGVGSPDSDVVESTVVSQGDGADAVDLVGADPVVGLASAVAAGGGLGTCPVGRRGGVVRCSRERCGRWVLYSVRNRSSRTRSSARVAG